MKATIARPYSKAIFLQAQKEGALDTWLEALEFLEMVLANVTMVKIVGNPNYSDDRLEELLLSITTEFSTTQKNLVKILVVNKRLDVVPEIREQYEELKATVENTVMVEIISAYELSSEQLQNLGNILEKKMTNKVEISAKIDADLIGGLVVRAGDTVIDSSVRGRVEQFGGMLTI